MTIGLSPDGQSATFAAGTLLRSVERAEPEGRAVVRERSTRIVEVAERARERMDRLSEFDPATQDVMIDVLRALEEQPWMIRAQFDDRRER